jgi:hypothetical protein
MKTHTCSNTPPPGRPVTVPVGRWFANKGGVCVAVEWCVAVLLCCVLSLLYEGGLLLLCAKSVPEHSCLRSALCALLHAACCLLAFADLTACHASSRQRGICFKRRGISPEPASRATPASQRRSSSDALSDLTAIELLLAAGVSQLGSASCLRAPRSTHRSHSGSPAPSSLTAAAPRLSLASAASKLAPSIRRAARSAARTNADTQMKTRHALVLSLSVHPYSRSGSVVATKR